MYICSYVHTNLDLKIDILIFSETLEDHINTLRAVLVAVASHNLSLHPGKCEIAQTEIDFLGYRLGNNMVKPSKENVEMVL